MELQSVPGRIAPATLEQLKGALTEGYAAPVDKPVEDVLRATQMVLGQAGFTFTPAGSPGAVFYSEPRTIKLTSKQADCGKLYGLSYVGDKRTETTVLIAVSDIDSTLRVRAAVNGILRVDTPKSLGGGPADKALTCTSTGALEHELADKILAALH